MLRDYLVLDIETVPDTSRWQADADAPPVFPPTWAHRIVSIGYAWLDRTYRLVELGVARSAGTTATTATPADAAERARIDDLSHVIGRARPTLVTYNGRAFDLPVIAQRALGHGASIPWYYRERAVRTRYSDDGHLDLCDWLADHGAARAGSLDAIAHLIGLPGKIGVDGSKVAGLYAAGEQDAIDRYCLADVAQTALLLVRFRLLQGALDAEHYRAAATALLDAFAADARVAPVLAATDRARYLP